MPPGAGAAPLRIDFVSALTTIEIASIRLSSADREYFSATTSADFDRIAIRGDAQRLPGEDLLRIRVTGIDPQLYLPTIATPGDHPLFVQIRLRALADR